MQCCLLPPVLARETYQWVEVDSCSNYPDTPVPLRCPIKVTKSIDIAFNEERDNLYYWARVLNAFLFSWQLKDVVNNPNSVSATQYSCVRSPLKLRNALDGILRN